MFKNTQNDENFEISYMIHISTKKYPHDLVKLLKEHKIKFGIWKMHNLKAEGDIHERNKKTMY